MLFNESPEARGLGGYLLEYLLRLSPYADGVGSCLVTFYAMKISGFDLLLCGLLSRETT